MCRVVCYNFILFTFIQILSLFCVEFGTARFAWDGALIPSFLLGTLIPRKESPLILKIGFLFDVWFCAFVLWLISLDFFHFSFFIYCVFFASLLFIFSINSLFAFFLCLFGFLPSLAFPIFASPSSPLSLLSSCACFVHLVHFPLLCLPLCAFFISLLSLPTFFTYLIMKCGCQLIWA